MEPCFDLTEARMAWLAGLESRQTFSGGQLRELESHLDDALEDLRQRGLSASEAFFIATRRLGGSAGLAEEYQKLASNPVWAIRGKWMLLGIISYLTALAVTRTGTEVVSVLAVKAPQGGVRLVVTALGVLLSSMLGLWLLHHCLHAGFRRLPVWVRRYPFRAACGVWLAVATIPAAAGMLANVQVISTVGLADFSEQLLVRRCVLLAGPFLWFPIIALSFRKYWRKSPVTF